MRVTRAQADAHREKILEVAGSLFRKHGFDGIGVAEIMKCSGLTHGGFYGHFGSKEDLAARASARVLSGGGPVERLTGTRAPSLESLVRGYLSREHRDDPSRGCLLAAVGSDVWRQPASIRRAFTEGLRSNADALQKLVRGRSAAARREKALATLAGLVGAVVLARAVDDRALSDEILSATAEALERS